jgi:hypothetical protein
MLIKEKKRKEKNQLGDDSGTLGEDYAEFYSGR